MKRLEKIQPFYVMELLKRAKALEQTAAIPGQYFNHIIHLVGMIRQKYDVACAEYRLECP